MAETEKTTTKKTETKAATAKPATKKTTTKAATAKPATKKTTTKAETAKKVETKATETKTATTKKTTTKKTTKKAETPSLRLKDKYINDVVPALMEEFKYKSVMQAPKLVKVVINIGVGDAAKNSKLLEESLKELTLITGQKPIVTKAKKSIASFRLREGMPIGCKVTLRGAKMYHFLDKLINISLPRVRDFRGLSKNSFDGRGNYTLGIREQIIFPEVDYDLVNVIRGMDVVIVTTAETDKEALGLLSGLGMPFVK